MTFTRSLIVGSILIVVGGLLFIPLLAGYPPSDLPWDRDAKAILTGFGCILLLLGISVLRWNAPFPLLRIPGKEYFLRAILVVMPFAILAGIELVLIANEKTNQSLTHLDLKAMDIMAAGRGKLDYKQYKMFAPSDDPLFRINKHGFRTYEFDRPPGSEYRVVLLGGSTAFSWGVAEKHTIASNLETALRDRIGQKVLVYNLGVPAIGFRHENNILKDLLDRIRPSLVIYYHAANDGYAWFQNIIGRAAEKTSLDPPMISVSTLLHFVYRIRVLRAVLDFVNARAPARDLAHLDFHRAMNAYDEQYRVSERLCKPVNCIYILQPTIFDRAWTMDNEHRIVRETQLRWPGIGEAYKAYVDRLMVKSYPNHFDARASVASVTGHVFYDHVHTTSLGNRLIAEFITDTICDQQIAPCR